MIESMGEFDKETKVCALNLGLLPELNRETTILHLPTILTLSSETATLSKTSLNSFPILVYVLLMQVQRS